MKNRWFGGTPFLDTSKWADFFPQTRRNLCGHWEEHVWFGTIGTIPTGGKKGVKWCQMAIGCLRICNWIKQKPSAYQRFFLVTQLTIATWCSLKPHIPTYGGCNPLVIPINNFNCTPKQARWVGFDVSPFSVLRRVCEVLPITDADLLATRLNLGQPVQHCVSHGAVGKWRHH